MKIEVVSPRKPSLFLSKEADCVYKELSEWRSWSRERTPPLTPASVHVRLHATTMTFVPECTLIPGCGFVRRYKLTRPL